MLTGDPHMPVPRVAGTEGRRAFPGLGSLWFVIERPLGLATTADRARRRTAWRPGP